MHIAICEDDRQDMELACSILQQYDQQHRFTLTCFSSGADLLAAAEQTAFDIALIDIEMTAPNGFEAAQRLQALPAPPLIIFATRSMDYAIRGYGVAFRYLAKPLTPEKLVPALDAAVRELRADRFVFSLDGAAYVLRMQQIYYFDVYDHVTTVHTADEKYAIRTTLKDVLAQLPRGYFGMPHQSYIVNFAHVKTATTQEIYLTSGVRIPVSRRRQVDFMAQLQQYLGR